MQDENDGVDEEQNDAEILNALLFVTLMGILLWLLGVHINQYWTEASDLQERADIIGWNIEVNLFDHSDVADEIVKWELQYQELKALEKRAMEIQWPMRLGGPPYFEEKLKEIEERIRHSEQLHPRVVALQKRAAEIGMRVERMDSQTALLRDAGPEVIRSFPYQEESIEKTEQYLDEMEILYKKVDALKEEHGIDLLRTRQLTSVVDDFKKLEQWQKDGLVLAEFDLLAIDIERWFELRDIFTEAQIPAGSFIMGCELEKDENCEADESPAHEVEISRSFYMMKAEVSQGIYAEIMGGNPTTYRNDDENKEDFIELSYPVADVEWVDALEFANQLSQLYGLEECYEINDDFQVKWPKKLDCKGWRLPTEAEWSYAAKGGEDYLYPGSDDCEEVAWANCKGLAPDLLGQKEYPRKGLHYSCEKKPNGYGLCDMAGNVEEWVWDIYDQEYFQQSPKIDPLGAETIEQQLRLRKGGGWQATASLVLPFKRSAAVQDKAGLRLVRTAR